MDQKKFVCIPGISFLLRVKYVCFMQQNSALDLFPHQCRYIACTYPFSPQSSASKFCLYIASNLLGQKGQTVYTELSGMGNDAKYCGIEVLHSVYFVRNEEKSHLAV